MKLLDQTIELGGSQVLDAKRYRILIWQRRLLALITVLAWLGIPVLIVAMLMPNWATIDFTNVDDEHVHVQLGVWGEWRHRRNATTPQADQIVEWIPHFPEPPDHVLRLADTDLKHYYRAQALLLVIAVVLLVVCNCLALYTFCHHRFVYKRLTAMLYLLTGGSVVAAIEVLVNSVDEWNTAVAYHSEHGDWDFSESQSRGPAILVAWSVALVCFAATLVFFWNSSKNKGSRAATADFELEDRDVHIDR